MSRFLSLSLALFLPLAAAGTTWAQCCGSACSQASCCEPACCTTVEKTICVPEWTTETRTIEVIECTTEQREKTVTVYKRVPEMKTVEYQYTVMVPETRTKTVDYTVCKPVWSEVEQEYTVMVPARKPARASAKSARWSKSPRLAPCAATEVAGKSKSSRFPASVRDDCSATAGHAAVAANPTPVPPIADRATPAVIPAAERVAATPRPASRRSGYPTL